MMLAFPEYFMSLDFREATFATDRIVRRVGKVANSVAGTFNGCFRRPGGAILIQIADDGVGLPEGFDPAKDGGLGMRMVRMLADQLGASLTFESTGIGLTVRLLIPPPRPVPAE